jgi:DNA-binding transcriptional regulator YhcF (GntR family)
LLIVVDPHSGVPVYRQIIEQVRFQVAAGLVLPGDELPSTRTLSQELGVNPMTVSKAYAQLEEEGVVRRRPGLPLVVAARGEAAEEAARLGQLKALLQPVAVAARQLGVAEEDAVGMFRQALAEAPQEEEARA